MNSSQQTATPPAPPAGLVSAPDAPTRSRLARAVAVRPRMHHLALAGVLALSAVLNTNRLAQNGYANVFYSAGVKSMLRSLHNFIYLSSDPGGLISIDKPPLGVWVQVASAKLFGFAPLSLLLPEAIIGVLCVALLYYLMAPRFGVLAALAGALALAVFPSFVAVSRDNGVDPLLILLMLLACGAGLRAAEAGGWRMLIASAVLVGLAFNTKTLAALPVVPGIALAYLLCAPGSLSRRIGKLLLAGAVMVAVSVVWLAFVDLTPASKRPYVGSTTNNSEFGLAFEYNGFGRVEGQVGGPGQIPVVRSAPAVPAAPPGRPPRPGAPAGHGAPAAASPPSRSRARAPATSPTGRAGARAAVHRPPPVSHAPSNVLPNGRDRNPIPFGGPVGPLRLFGVGLGDQGGWILPFAFVGMLGLALIALRREWARRDPRLAGSLIFGGWFLIEALLLSLSKGIVHPYYVSAIAPGTAAVAGAGAVVFAQLAIVRPRDWRIVLAPCAVLATVAAQIVLLNREHYLQWFIPLLLVGATVGVVAMHLRRRFGVPAMALTFGLLLVAPTAYATTTWLAPVEGTFPAAGPTQAAGAGGIGVSAYDLQIDRALLRYVLAHRPGTRWVVLTDAADTAAPFILLGHDAGSLAGFSGTDPALDGRGLARLVASGQARYVALGGEFTGRGGNRATHAVAQACRLVPHTAWHGPTPNFESLKLYDCAGREAQLRAEPQLPTG